MTKIEITIVHKNAEKVHNNKYEFIWLARQNQERVYGKRNMQMGVQK